MPTIDIPDKICSHCGGTLWYFRQSKSNIYTCYIKRTESSKKLYEKNKNVIEVIEKKKIWMKNWRASNKEHVKEYKKIYDKKTGLESKRRRSRNASIKLTDYYIRNIINSNLSLSLSKDDIPKDLIDLQRKTLLIKRRILKDLTNPDDTRMCYECKISKSKNEFYTPGTLLCKKCQYTKQNLQQKLKLCQK